ncbi:alpha/beta fold hydrolase [Shimia ponticola]|uniref:alpha/beta fold hydrolase n=1 Tax=Shimia ponticola TaxID=2582893 RepID=UPI0011BD8839|nr:alpha/beta fold hydrolase [Shimia ponticola]
MPKDFVPSALERMLELLDKLYEASETTDPYAEMVVASDLFFFSQSGQRDLADDIPSSLDELASFRKHITRLQRTLFAEADNPQTAADPGERLANICIHLETNQITGNSAAEALIERSLPCHLDELPLDADSKVAVDRLVANARKGIFQGTSVLPLSFEHREDMLITRCMKRDNYSIHADTDPQVQLTISYVHWTPEVLQFAIKEFGLTEAELEVLLKLLSGSSQTQTAEMLGKSRETVKAQAKSILRKFGATQMADVHATALAYAYLGPTVTVEQLSPPAMSGPTLSSARMVSVGQGREVQVFEYGDPDGQPILFWHGLIVGPFFTPHMIASFRAAGLRVIGISRPGFGRSAPPTRWPDFNATVTEDTQRVLDHLGIDKVAFWVHHAGISFACRAAGAMPGRVLGAAMNGAGVPIRKYMLRKMNRETRVAAATVVYAPQLLEIMLRAGFRTWRKTGPVAFYREFFGKDGVEQQTLTDPEFARLFELGMLHTSAQDPKAMVWDGKSAMSDWSDAYNHLRDLPQHWMHGDVDQILDHSFVEEFLEQEGQNPPLIVKGYGSDLLYRGFDQVFSETRQFFETVNPAG